MVSHGRVELLAHPLSQKYLQMKWNSYGKYFHVTNLFVYSVFLMFVTLYSSQLMTNVIDNNPKLVINGTEVANPIHSRTKPKWFDKQKSFQLPDPIDTSGITPAPLHSRHQTQYIGSAIKSTPPTFKQIEVTNIMIVSAIAISIYAVCSSVREIVHIYQQKLNYLLDPSHCISWLLYISSLIMVMPVFCKGSVSDASFSAASITVFLSWFNLLLLLQRFDQVCHHCVPKHR